MIWFKGGGGCNSFFLNEKPVQQWLRLFLGGLAVLNVKRAASALSTAESRSVCAVQGGIWCPYRANSHNGRQMKGPSDRDASIVSLFVPPASENSKVCWP